MPIHPRPRAETSSSPILRVGNGMVAVLVFVLLNIELGLVYVDGRCKKLLRVF